MTIEEWSERGYSRMHERIDKYCIHRHHRRIDEDVWQHTLLRVLEKERATGLADNSAEGIDNYVFMAYKINAMRETQYPRVSRTTLTDDIGQYDREDESADDLYLECAEVFGTDLVDKVIDGAEVDPALLADLTEYVYNIL